MIMTQLADYQTMSEKDARPGEKRLTLRLAVDVWRELRMEAVRRDLTTTGVIQLAIKEKLAEWKREREEA
jgi:hypothetical protein